MPFERTTFGRIRQCPYCELRFAEEWELDQHLEAEHHVGGSSREDERNPGH